MCVGRKAVGKECIVGEGWGNQVVRHNGLNRGLGDRKDKPCLKMARVLVAVLTQEGTRALGVDDSLAL